MDVVTMDFDAARKLRQTRIELGDLLDNCRGCEHTGDMGHDSLKYCKAHCDVYEQLQEKRIEMEALQLIANPRRTPKELEDDDKQKLQQEG